MHIIKIRVVIQKSSIFENAVPDCLFPEMNRRKHIRASGSRLFIMPLKLGQLPDAQNSPALCRISHHQIVPVIAISYKFTFVQSLIQPFINHNGKTIARKAHEVFRNLPEHLVVCSAFYNIALELYEQLLLVQFIDPGNHLVSRVLSVIKQSAVRTSAALGKNALRRHKMISGNVLSCPDICQNFHRFVADIFPHVPDCRYLRLKIKRLIKIIKSCYFKIPGNLVSALLCLVTESCCNIVICTDKNIRKFYHPALKTLYELFEIFHACRKIVIAIPHRVLFPRKPETVKALIV